MLSVGGGGAVAVKHARGDRPQTAPLPRGARQSLCGCDRSARIHGGNLLQEPEVGAGCLQASRRRDRNAGVRAALHCSRPLYGALCSPQYGRLTSNIITETRRLRFELCKAAIKKYDK